MIWKLRMPGDKHNRDTRLEGSFRTIRKSGRRAYEPLKRRIHTLRNCRQFHRNLFEKLQSSDSEVCELIIREYDRLQGTLQLVAAENRCSPAVLGALGSIVQNKTAEGYPGARLHSGCEVIDRLESLAVERAKEVFGARYANVQPHCGTSANLIVITALLQKGDKILSLPAEQGGHFSHGAENSITGKFFDIENYYLDEKTLLLDYDSVREKAAEVKPRLIICGASVYSRAMDFAKFREIADGVGAFLLADISHISALVAAGAHPSPIDYAHFTTTSTYKPGGPRGGLILMGKDKDREVQTQTEQIPLWRLIDRAAFPGLQGTVYFNNVAGKAVFFKEMLSDEYKDRQFKVIENARQLATSLVGLGYDVVTGGTDSHMVLVNVADSRPGLTGSIARGCLEECGIVVDRVELPYEKEGGMSGNGLRLGTPIVTKMGMGAEQMNRIAASMDAVLKNVEIISDSEYKMDPVFKQQVKDRINDLCAGFAAF